MAKLDKKDLETQVIVGAREYGICLVLFRHAVGEMLGLNVTDMECLGVLFFKGVSTPSELSKYTGLSSGATTAMLDRMERAGLIERTPNPKDRRSTNIAILKDASHKVGPLFEFGRLTQNDLVASYSEDELELLADFFSKSTAMWEDVREHLKTISGGSRRQKKPAQG